MQPTLGYTWGGFLIVGIPYFMIKILLFRRANMSESQAGQSGLGIMRLVPGLRLADLG